MTERTQPDATLAALRDLTAAAAMVVNRHEAGEPISERIWAMLREAAVAAAAVVEAA
jgi:hypothetical protein